LTGAANKTLVFEPSLAGHRANYVAIHTKEFLELGAEVCLAVPENVLDQPEGKAFLSDVLPHTRYIPLPPLGNRTSSLANAKAKLGLLRESVAKCQPGHCFVPYADGISQAWGMSPRPKSLFPRAMPIEGLMMQGKFAYPKLGWKQKLSAEASLYFQRRAPWTRLHHLDPLAFNRIDKLSPSSTQYCLIPDIIERRPFIEASHAKQKLGIAADRYLVVCPGAVNAHKGSDTLIDAVLAMDTSIPVQLMLFGKHSPEIKAKLKDLDDARVVSVDRFSTPEEFDLLFAAADLISVCYPRHIGSASILLRAAAAGKQVIASDFGWIGWATNKFRLGQACDATSPDAIKDLIQECFASKNESSSGQQLSLAEHFVNYHSVSNHLAHWTRLYRQLHGLPQPQYTPFADVLRRATEPNHEV